MNIDNKFQEALSILRRKQVEKILGLSRSTLYDRLDPKSPRYDPSFPKPVGLGFRAVGFLRGEVEAWLAAQVQKSRAA
jgi:prophage regulatory protein